MQRQLFELFCLIFHEQNDCVKRSRSFVDGNFGLRVRFRAPTKAPVRLGSYQKAYYVSYTRVNLALIFESKKRGKRTEA